MSVKVQLKHSATANKAPQPADLVDGELALNINSASPAAYIKDSAGNIVKLAGAGAIGGTPATETAAGIVELATAVETTIGTDSTRAVHPAGLKVELDKKAPLASPALTGVPTAPTAAAGTNTTQVATTEFVTAAVAVENLWDRTGTVVSPTTAGDDVFTSGAVKVGGTSAAPNIEVKADGGIVANTDGLVYDAATKRLGVGTTSPNKTLTVVGDIIGSSLASNESLVLNCDDNANNAGKDAIIFQERGSEKMRLDGSGRLLVGTSTSPTGNNGQYAKLVVQGQPTNPTGGANISIQKGEAATSITSGEGIGNINWSDSAGNTFAVIACEADANAGSGDYPGRLVFRTTADGASSPTERMRITQAGDVLIGTVTSYGAGVTLRQNATSQFKTTITGTASAFVVTTGTYDPAMAVRGNGGIANYSANNANLSDRNSKKDIAPAADTWDCIKEWEIVNYRYKDQSAESDLNIGVIAQQVAESCPEVITVFEEAKDDQPEKLGVKEQQMHWMAIKALQEAQVRIETLEAKVAALESA